MTDTKQRGGARKGAGRPRKQDYKVCSISPSLTTLEQLQRIHPEITTAVEMAAQFYEETNKMNAKQKLEKLIEENVGLNNVTVEKRWNPILSEDQYCITAADGVMRETFLGKTVKDAEDHIEKMEVAKLALDQ
jgi:hypothetical protein